MKHHFCTLAFSMMVISILSSNLAFSNDQDPEVTLLTEPQLWQLLELRLTGIPAASNPFDPEEITVDAIFTAPSGHSLQVLAFWYQAYSREKVEGAEKLTAEGSPEWRIRFTPTERGTIP
jgi:hypothetical protein